MCTEQLERAFERIKGEVLKSLPDESLKDKVIWTTSVSGVLIIVVPTDRSYPIVDVVIEEMQNA